MVRRFSEGVPAWKSERCRMLRPSSSGGSPATGTRSSRRSSHCASNRPQPASNPPPATRAASPRLVAATHAVELVAKPATRGSDPLAQHLDALLVRRVPVAAGGDRVIPVRQQARDHRGGRGDHSYANQTAHGRSLPVLNRRPPTARGPPAPPPARVRTGRSRGRCWAGSTAFGRTRPTPAARSRTGRAGPAASDRCTPTSVRTCRAAGGRRPTAPGGPSAGAWCTRTPRGRSSPPAGGGRPSRACRCRAAARPASAIRPAPRRCRHRPRATPWPRPVAARPRAPTTSRRRPARRRSGSGSAGTCRQATGATSKRGVTDGGETVPESAGRQRPEQLEALEHDLGAVRPRHPGGSEEADVGLAPVREAAIALALGPRELLVHIGETADLDVGGADHAQRIAVAVEDHAQLAGPRARLATLVRGTQAGGRPLRAVAHQQAELGGHPGVAAEPPGGVVAVRAGGRDERPPEPADAVVLHSAGARRTTGYLPSVLTSVPSAISRSITSSTCASLRWARRAWLSSLWWPAASRSRARPPRRIWVSRVRPTAPRVSSTHSNTASRSSTCSGERARVPWLSQHSSSGRGAGVSPK